MDQVLTPGEFEALIHQTPKQVQHLVWKLAIHHGHARPTEDQCPICKNRKPEQQEIDLGGEQR